METVKNLLKSKNMKSVKKLQSEIEDKIKEINEYAKIDTPENKRRIKTCRTRLAYLKMCKMYVETNPTEVFLKKERDRLDNRVNLIFKEYKDPLNMSRSEALKEKKAFEKEMGVPKIRKQLTALNFLLA